MNVTWIAVLAAYVFKLWSTINVVLIHVNIGIGIDLTTSKVVQVNIDIGIDLTTSKVVQVNIGIGIDLTTFKVVD